VAAAAAAAARGVGWHSGMASRRPGGGGGVRWLKLEDGGGPNGPFGLKLRKKIGGRKKLGIWGCNFEFVSKEFSNSNQGLNFFENINLEFEIKVLNSNQSDLNLN
jgi:hypothetical protein